MRKKHLKRTGPPPFVCFNCDQVMNRSLPVRLFCSEACADEAKFVRYWRRCTRDGRINQPDVLEALQIRLAHIMAGGYSERERHITRSRRAEVFKRDEGRCRECGQPGTDI